MRAVVGPAPPAPPAGIALGADVRNALASGGAVVALETTIVCHGLPYPKNLEVAERCEAAVRAAGAVPATIALVHGVPTAGLTREQLELLAREGTSVAKCSRRDIPALAARRSHGACTVSGTMAVAAAAGIRVFATGGIGGVHRGGERSMDVSCDLIELGRTRMCVVCAGAKSLLDIPRTLEVLETQGVCVATLGSAELPAFFTAGSGIASPHTLGSAGEAAAALAAADGLGSPASLLLCVPPPPSEDGEAAQRSLEEAIRAADEAGVSGNEVTPFILKRTHQSSRGRSLRVNADLVQNNARVAAQVAVALCGGGA